MREVTNCQLCPRHCGADRTKTTGFCGGGNLPRVARAALHLWEEPCISGSKGSGTVFFSGCPLGCCFCQNGNVSRQNYGAEISVARLADIFVELAAQGAHNINLVSPTQYIPWIVEALEQVKPTLGIPVVYNTGGYELTESLKLLDGLVDVYLPDLKYADAARGVLYSGAADYPQLATAAIDEMVRQTGACAFDEAGLLLRGTIIRHLVLPAGKEDSLAVVRGIAAHWGDSVMVSLMSQYTPQYYTGERKELHRRVSSWEYNTVVALAAELGLQGFMQERSSAKGEYTPDFALQGVLEEK